MRLQMRRLDLRSPLHSAINRVRPSAEAANLSLTAALPEAACVVKGDGDRLQQAFANVLANAVKFTDSGGIHVAVITHSTTVEVQVADTGRGIEADFLPLVFERFETGDRSAQRQSGLGLGLAISRDLLERQNGTIKIASPGRGRGTTVTLRLPLALAPR